MESAMSTQTKNEVMNKLRRRYGTAGREHKRKLLDEAVALLGYHRKVAIRALGAKPPAPWPRVMTGRPRKYDEVQLRPVLRAIWSAANYPCGRRLAGMMADWVSSYEAHEKSVVVEVTFKISDQVAEALGETPDAIARRILENAAIESYRAGRLSHSQAGQMLSLDYWEAENFSGNGACQ